uniref:Uncharacterized protein n=1 Tax=Nosema pernyi TaxID=1112939 RepID=X5EM02_9MICR|nr:hypothetical protein NP_05A10 [Nosema pernyi]
MRKAQEIRYLCQVIIIKFYKFIKTLETIRYEAIRSNEYDESSILKIWEVEKYIFGIVNTLFKTSSSLLIPSTNKFEFVKSYDDVKKRTKKIYYMIKSLKERFNLEILLKSEKKKEEGQCAWQKKFVKDADSILEDLKDNGPDSINRYRNKLIKDLEFLDSLVKKSTDKNEVKDMITVDCDVKTVDKFVEKYSLFLLEYCDILTNFDELLLNKNFFEYTYNYEDSLYFTTLKNMHDDILIARELKKYLSNYQNDKTDFLIFSQTDYFENRLLEKIKVNLQKCLYAFWKKNDTLGNILGKNYAKFSDDDDKYTERIEKLRKDLISAFNLDDPSEQQTFKKIISNLENPVQNNDISSRNVADGVNQNANNGQSEDNNNENQKSLQTSEQTNLDKNQNNNNDQTSDEIKLEENPNPLENNASKDESNQTVSGISKDTNLDTSKNDNTQENGQELNKNIIVEDNNENLKGNGEENVKILSDNEQNPKESSNQTDNKINSDETNGSNYEKSDRPSQNEAQINTSENKLNLDDDQKIIEGNKVNDDASPKENNNEITQKQNVKSTFLDDYLIYTICGCVFVAFGIVGALIYYFKNS